MAVLPTILGGGEIGGVTPEQIANYRAIAQSMANKPAPRTFGEGLSSLGDAIDYVALNRRAEAAQKAGTDSASADFAGLFPDGSDGGQATAPASTPDPALGGAGVMANADAPTSVADFTASKEGFSPTAYKDGAQWSIGYGTKATPEEIAGQPISEADAKARLQQELGTADSYVTSNVKVPLNQNQRLALDDAAYNLGSFGPGLLGAINSGDPTAVPSHLAQYTGSWSPANQAGLANRRQAEISLWNSPVNGAPAAPVTAGAQPSAPSAPVQVASLDPTAGVAQALQNQPVPAGGPTGPSPGVAGVAQALSSAPARGAPAAPAAPSPGVATVAQAIGARSAPPQAAPVAPAPQLPQVPPAQLAAAQRILANRFSTPAEIAQATAVLTQARNYADPEYGIKLQTEQTQLNQLQHPPMSIQTAKDGTILGVDPRTGAVTPIYKGQGIHSFTDQDRSTFNIPPDQAGYVDAAGEPHYLGSSSLAQTEDALNSLPAPIAPNDPDYASKPIYGGLTQATVDQKALSNLADGQPSPQGRGTGVSAIQNAAVANRMGQFGGNTALNRADFKALGGALSDQTEYLNTVQRAFKTAEATLGTVTDWMQKNNINPSAYPDFNSLINFASGHGLDVGPIKGFQSQVAQLRAEYAMVLARGGQITDSTRAAANEIVPDNVTPTDLLTIAGRLNVDGEKAIEAGTQQIDQIHKQLAGIAPAPGAAPAPAAPAAGGATATPSAAPIPPGGTPVPKGGFTDGGSPPKSFTDAGGTPEMWKYVPPEQRSLWQ